MRFLAGSVRSCSSRLMILSANHCVSYTRSTPLTTFLQMRRIWHSWGARQLSTPTKFQYPCATSSSMRNSLESCSKTEERTGKEKTKTTAPPKSRAVAPDEVRRRASLTRWHPRLEGKTNAVCATSKVSRRWTWNENLSRGNTFFVFCCRWQSCTQRKGVFCPFVVNSMRSFAGASTASSVFVLS